MDTVDDIREILKYLPHRYPFLLVDRVVDWAPDSHLTAVKNVSINEPIFTGHFPQAPIFPGVLILEAMAQTAALQAFKSHGDYPGEQQLYLLVGIDSARFRKQVVPGDQMLISAKLLKVRRGIYKYDALATVDGDTVCTAEVIIAQNEIEP